MDREEFKKLIRAEMQMILDRMSDTPIALIDESYKKNGDFAYICADGRCVDIIKEV